MSGGENCHGRHEGARATSCSVVIDRENTLTLHDHDSHRDYACMRDRVSLICIELFKGIIRLNLYLRTLPSNQETNQDIERERSDIGDKIRAVLRLKPA